MLFLKKTISDNHLILQKGKKEGRQRDKQTNSAHSCVPASRAESTWRHKSLQPQRTYSTQGSFFLKNKKFKMYNLLQWQILFPQCPNSLGNCGIAYRFITVLCNSVPSLISTILKSYIYIYKFPEPNVFQVQESNFLLYVIQKRI